MNAKQIPIVLERVLELPRSKTEGGINKKGNKSEKRTRAQLGMNGMDLPGKLCAFRRGFWEFMFAVVAALM